MFLFLSHQKPLKETVYFSARKKCEDCLNIISFNCSAFNKFKNDTLSNQLDKKFLNHIKSQDIDFMFLQEFHHDDMAQFRVLDSIVNKTTLDYYFISPNKINNQSGFFGMIIFSKYPIVNRSTFTFDSLNFFNKFMYVDVKLNNDTVRLLNLHFQSLNYRWNKKLTFKNNLLVGIRKMKSGIDANRIQSKKVLDFIDQSPYPIIVAGDFNSFPYGRTYQQFKKTSLENSFEKAGNGFGYSLNIFPYWVRLDHVFFDKNHFNAQTHKVLRGIDNSDHLPIWVQLKKK
ncbi:MAG: endonuclease/exonuclease/phosphatase family protein [Cytophagales bacterium]